MHETMSRQRRNFLKLAGTGALALAFPKLSAHPGYKPKLGLQLYTVRKSLETDFEGTMRKVADLGFLGIETYALPGNVSLRHAAKVFKDLGLEVSSMHTVFPFGSSRDDALKMAEAYDCKRLVYAGWPEEEKYKDVETIRHTADIYEETRSSLAKHGISFGLHNHWWEFEPHDGFIPFSFLLEHLDKRVFFEIDTYWTKTGGKDPAKVVSDFGARAPLLHIKDGPAVKGDLANKQLPAGQGTMDIPAIVKAGGTNIEWMIVEFDEYEKDIFNGMRDSYAYLTKNGLAEGKK